MKPQFLPVVLGGVRRSFTPARLFTSGVTGAWYDPSDYSTLFQDSAGTTPVTAVEQPVGLMLDKSQGATLGAELVTNGDFASGTGWTLGAGWSISGGEAVATAVTSGAFLENTGQCVSGQWYCATVTVSSRTAGGFSFAVGGTAAGQIYTAVGTYTQYFLASSTGFIQLVRRGSDFTGSIDNISVKSIAGNHASQATSASRPILRARYNQLTYSEDITNAAWFMLGTAGGSRGADETTAPDGTFTADRYSVGTGSGSWYIANYAGPSLVSGQSYTFSVYLKANGYNFAFIRPHNNTANFGASGFIVNLTDGTITYPSSPLAPASTGTATSVGNGWWRVTATSTANLTTAPAGGPAIWPRPNNSFSNASGTDGANFTGDGTSGAYIWGADFRTGSSAGTYQRIAAAADYATAGFAPYLSFDGVDDFLSAAYVQNAYPLTITAGVENTIGNAGTGIASVAQSDSQYKQLRDDATNITASQDRNATSIVPTVVVVSGNKFCISQFETSLITHQVNGGTATTIANTNAFGTSANIFVGKTRPSGLFSSARDYGVVITNTVLTAAEKDSLKNWMAKKMGVTL